MRTRGGAECMSPITRATRPSTRFPCLTDSSQQGRGAGRYPSKPRMRKCPQRVGKSASAIFTTRSKLILYFTASLEGGTPLNLPIGCLKLKQDAAGLRYIECVVDDKLILITLLVKLGVAASVSSALARSRTFQRLLFAERRRTRQTLELLAFFLVPLTLGVYFRLRVPNFLAADLSFETVTLLGLLLGPAWAMLAA